MSEIFDILRNYFFAKVEFSHADSLNTNFSGKISDIFPFFDKKSLENSNSNILNSASTCPKKIE